MPSFYMETMKELQREWTADFDPQTIIDPTNPPTMVSSTTGGKVVRENRVVIDDILLYSTNMFTLIRHFACVARIFVRFRLSFKLSKCKFFDSRVEYLSYDLTSCGNCTAKSKFDLLTDWTLPIHETPLLYCYGIVFFLCVFLSLV